MYAYEHIRMDIFESDSPEHLGQMTEFSSRHESFSIFFATSFYTKKAWQNANENTPEIKTIHEDILSSKSEKKPLR